MLFLRPGSSKPVRAQASLVTDEEIERVITFIKQQRQPAYREALAKTLTKDPVTAHLDVKDEMYDAAIEVVLTTGQASTSMLQRKLRLSYVRAARLMDLMEQEGIVGPGRGAKPREILVERERRVPANPVSTES
jgi:S-DNA-T family DNA segregation ATPase FtsK/SpoIIIE